MFSTTTGCPSSSPSFAATGREKESVGPPGGNGTIHLSGFEGYWAKPELAKARSRRQASLRIDALRLRVHEIARCLAGEHAQHFLGGGDAHALARLGRHAREMWREDRVVEREQRVAWLEAVVLVHVEHGAGDALLAQRLDQGGLFDHRAAADVDEPRAVLHASDAIAVEEVVRLGGERAGEDHEVARFHQPAEIRRQGLRRQALEATLVAEHAHAEAAPCDARDARADGAYAHDADGHAGDFVGARAHGARRVPRGLLQRVIDPEDVSR